MDNSEDIEQPHKKEPTLHRHKWLVAIITVIIILSAIFGWYIYSLTSNSNDTKLGRTELLKKVSDLNNNSKSEEAKKLIEKQTQVSYTDDAEVAVIYAQTLAANGDSNKAVEILEGLRKSAPANKEYDYVGKSAYILQVSGQKDKAIEFYKEAIVLAEALKPSTDDEKLMVGSALADYYWYLGQLELGNE